MELRVNPNKLTKYQESPIDLAIEHKTSALDLVLSCPQYHRMFNFNIQENQK